MHPDEVSTVIDQAGGMPNDRDITAQNLEGMKEQEVRVHLLHGKEDRVVDPADSTRLAEALQKAGIACTLQMMPGGHVPTPETILQVRKWIDAEVRVPN
jgi:predicted esterase